MDRLEELIHITQMTPDEVTFKSSDYMFLEAKINQLEEMIYRLYTNKKELSTAMFATLISIIERKDKDYFKNMGRKSMIEYYTLGEYMIAYDQTSDGRKTKIFDIVNAKDESIHLGQIRYNPKWRAYCFYPEINTVFDAKCLSKITSFIVQLSEERKRNA